MLLRHAVRLRVRGRSRLLSEAQALTCCCLCLTMMHCWLGLWHHEGGEVGGSLCDFRAVHHLSNPPSF